VRVNHILTCTDFSPGAEAGLDAAMDLARRFGARLTLVHVHDPSALLPPIAGLAPAASVDHLVDVEREIRRGLDEIVETRLAGLPRVKADLLVESGTAHAICRHAEAIGADMIVIATHGRTGLRHMLLGSVAEKVARHAHRPVLIVPMAS
jgi:nucleotide-binding universal stress UspA family protein